MGNNNFSEAKNALLQKWLRGQSNDTSVTIHRRPANSRLSLSFPQQRQLFLEMLQPGTAVNNLSVLLDITGKPDFSVLEKCANEIISRHDALRTSFSFVEGLPAAKITDRIKISIPIVDLRSSAPTEDETKAYRLAEKEVVQPFDLSHAPLLRLKLYVLSDQRSQLLVIVHHTVADGWSLGVFLNELVLLYQNFSTGTAPLLPELPIQYADFAHWQTDPTRISTMQSALQFWKRQLGGQLPAIELPSDRLRNAKQTFAGATHRFTLSGKTTSALEKFCQQENVTLFMTLLATFEILLRRYSGQDDILIGTPVANRNLPELENLIGVFINTIVLRSNLDGDPIFRDLLKRVKEICLNAYVNQDLPFEKVVEELKPKRDLSRSPIFQVVFNLQNSPLHNHELSNLRIVPMEMDRGVSQFDLGLMMTRSEGHYNCTVEYNSDLFEPGTITKMFVSFQLLLHDVLINPEFPISKLKIVEDSYFHHVVHHINHTESDFPRTKCFHHLFEEQVQRTPDSVALIHGERSLTYLELNSRANRLARHLQAIGVKRGSCVGVFMEKTLEVTEVLLAVLKTGGAYVPISTDFPDERVQFILKDANVSVLLTNTDTKRIDNGNVHVINLNSDNYSAISDCSTPPNPTKPEDLAYIIYTSGSTGHPKGVLVQHMALTNFLWSMQKTPGLDKKDILLSVTSISFDIAALELFLPLVVGARVVIAGKEILANPLLIGDVIDKCRVSVMQATPAMWQLLINAGWQGNLALKALCGGEMVTRTLADQILSRVGSLWNMYGPTETTIWSSVNQIRKDKSPITIGLPIANTQMYVLDKYMQVVPAGVTGELHIGGEGLARGYLNQPLLTDRKFIEDPFSSRPGARLYKTGDSARYLADHSIEIIGRIDDQIKIHGHRIELGEIASVIMQHPAVCNAVVVAQMEGASGKRLQAYFVSKKDHSVTENDLQEFVRKKLPPYMMPSGFIPLRELPLSPNGKIDRNSLPAPDRSEQSTRYTAPRNDLEQILAEIWQGVLEIERIGIHDNFFDLGGASVQSLHVVAAASQAGLRLSPEMIFEHQTIADLAEKLQND